MTFLSPAVDFQERTLEELGNAFERLGYIESLYEEGEGFRHWGMERIHGVEKARATIREAYQKEAGQLIARDLRSLWSEWAGAEDPEARSLSEPAPARRELSPLRARHLSLVFETLAALEAARPPRQAA